MILTHHFESSFLSPLVSRKCNGGALLTGAVDQNQGILLNFVSSLLGHSFLKCRFLATSFWLECAQISLWSPRDRP